MDIRSMNDIRNHLEKTVQDIKTGNSKPAYLLYGSEAYLKRQYKDKFLRIMTNAEDTMNFHRFEGKIDVQEVLAVANTLPFFADFRTIFIYRSEWFNTSCDEMVDYLKHPCETTRFLFVEDAVDKSKKLYKTIREVGCDINFMELDRDSIVQWITSLAAAEKKKISLRAIDQLMLKTGSDMNLINNEMNKLLSYTKDKNMITEEDISILVPDRLEEHIYFLVNAMVDKQQKRALQLYYDLLSAKTEPLEILPKIARQFNQLLQANDLRQKGYDTEGIARRMKLPPNRKFLAGKYPKQAARYTVEGMKKILRECLETEEAIKGGKMEGTLALEMLIVKYSM